MQYCKSLKCGLYIENKDWSWCALSVFYAPDSYAQSFKTQSRTGIRRNEAECSNITTKETENSEQNQSQWLLTSHENLNLSCLYKDWEVFWRHRFMQNLNRFIRALKITYTLKDQNLYIHCKSVVCFSVIQHYTYALILPKFAEHIKKWLFRTHRICLSTRQAKIDQFWVLIQNTWGEVQLDLSQWTKQIFRPMSSS